MVQSFYPLIALRLAEGTGDSSCFELPADHERVFSLLQTAAGRRQLGALIGRKVAEIPWSLFDAQLAAIERESVGVVTIYDRDYPACFRAIHQPPPFLLYRGDIRKLASLGVALVGSRNASVAACRFATKLASDVAALGISVVSGLALGVDSAAHRGALQQAGGTVAVIGTGLDVDYPRGNGKLSRAIAESGCVITEQLMGRQPERFVFPRRNRLISGASHIVVVVEAGNRSGALVTARWALEQGREVGAVPHFPGDARGVGVNRLLKAGAFPVEGVEDVLEAVPRLAPQALAPARPVGGGQDNAAGLAGAARAIFDALGGAPSDPDALAAHVGKPVSEVQRVLLDLEIRGLVARDATGSYYVVSG